MLPLQHVKFRLIEFVAENGCSPFADWFTGLDATVAARVDKYLRRMEQGNFGNSKGVGSGVQELKIDLGPGYRVYYARSGEILVVLLGGGDKSRQSRDIERAIMRWHEYQVQEK